MPSWLNNPFSGGDGRWIWFALAGAFFAAVSNVLSKPALDHLDVAVANTVRAVTMLMVLAIATTIQGGWSTLPGQPFRAWLFISLAGVAAALSWLFGYKALQLTDVNNSYPIDKLSVVFAVLLAMIFLKEKVSLVNWIAIAVMLIGGYLVTRPAGGSAS